MLPRLLLKKLSVHPELKLFPVSMLLPHAAHFLVVGRFSCPIGAEHVPNNNRPIVSVDGAVLLKETHLGVLRQTVCHACIVINFG